MPMIANLADKYTITYTIGFKFKKSNTMKNLFTLFFLLLASSIFAQQPIDHFHDSYCKHYPELSDIPKYAHRNDWQSQLVHKYDVTFYFLNLNVSHTSVAVSGTVQIHAKVVAPVLDTFAFELITAHTIQTMVINGTTYTNFSRIGDNVLVKIAPITQGNTIVASITYSGTPPTGGFFSGISTAYSSTWQKNVTWTLSEPFAAKDWFPCKQVLTDKADSVWVFLTVPAGTKAGSQGKLKNVVSVPNNRFRYEWKSNYPIVYYLISFAVADYQEYNIYAKPAAMPNDSILVQNYIYNHPNYLPQQKANIDAVVPMINLFSDKLTLYPFKAEKYGHCLTQLGGGMEHQTMSTMGSFSFDLVAHELGHMWFGDYVTCKTWSDIWINEGFATYTNFLARDFILGTSSGTSFIVSKQNNAMSQNGGSIFIPPSEITQTNVWRIFDGRLSYDKGAAIIHVLRNEINNDVVFFNVLKQFITQYANSAATGEDFRAVAETVSGINLQQFFAQWYYGEGFPRYNIEWFMAGSNVHLNVTQSPSASTPLFKMTMEYRLTFTDNSSTVVRLYQDANLKQFVVPVNKQVASIQVDPNNWTFEKVNSIIIGSSELQNPNYFTFGPNPATDYLTVYLPNTSSSSRYFQILDITGRIIQQEALLGSETKVNIPTLSAGTYFLRVSDGKQHWSRKFVK